MLKILFNEYWLDLRLKIEWLIYFDELFYLQSYFRESHFEKKEEAAPLDSKMKQKSAVGEEVAKTQMKSSNKVKSSAEKAAISKKEIKNFRQRSF